MDAQVRTVLGREQAISRAEVRRLYTYTVAGAQFRCRNPLI
jgi:hypothetical protein